MKRLQRSILALMLLAFAAFAPRPAGAQPAQPDPYNFTATVQVESAFARVLPARDADLAASLFEDDRLEVVGRNLDGTWFEVRRPGRFTSLGWMFMDTLDYPFFPEFLPLTDWTTGVLGDTPLTGDPGFGVYMAFEANLRAGPSSTSAVLRVVPNDIVVPVLLRDHFGSWLFVNYLGYQGWVAGFTTRELPNVRAIPLAPGLPPPDNIPTTIIPPEVQLAQVARLRDFVTASHDLAANLESFWWTVDQGQVMPCQAPPFVANYPYTSADVQQLPELARYIPRLDEAVEHLNAAIDPLTVCGVFDPRLVRDARNHAINARIIFAANLDVLDDLERNVIR